jgi:excisionase family DNA binding protein
MIPNFVSLTPSFVSVSEAGRILGAHPRTVRRLIASGKLRAIQFEKHYRVELDSIGALSVGAGNESAHVSD